MNDYKPLQLEDRDSITEFFLADPPQVSELTFTNLFMWRHARKPVWRVANDCLLIILRSDSGEPYGLPPVGRGDKGEALRTLCAELAGLHHEVRVGRADKPFIENHVDTAKYRVK